MYFVYVSAVTHLKETAFIRFHKLNEFSENRYFLISFISFNNYRLRLPHPYSRFENDIIYK